MNRDLPSAIRVQQVKTGWFQRGYQFLDDDNILAQLYYPKSYNNKATGRVDDREFLIWRSGFWKYRLEVSSAFPEYNMLIGINWRNTLKITDSGGHPYTFKSTGIWKSRWEWFDRYGRPILEIKSKNLSRKNRGLIEIKEDTIKDPLFWIVVSWFIILCSESDSAVAIAT